MMKKSSVFVFLFVILMLLAYGCTNAKKDKVPLLEESWLSQSLAEKGTLIICEEDYTVWGSSPVYDDEEKVHVFYSRWPKEGGSWLVDSEIAHAVADHPEGPYELLGTVMSGRGEGYWDANSIHNPSVYRVDGKYVMVYIGNDISTAQNWRSKAPEANSQRVGLAIADSPYGPWQRFDNPMIPADPDSMAWDGYCTVNPGFVKHPNGEFWIYYRAWDRNNDDRRKTGVAFAKNLEGPYVKYEKNPIIDKFEGVEGQTEDPVMFYYDGKFHCVIRDMGNWDWYSSLYLSSEDGLFWSYPQRGKHMGSTYYDIPDERRCERDQILMKDGVPEYIFSAVSKPGGSCGGALKINLDQKP
ncbi:glycoside hydrolase family protein [Bacteroidota bacterium]